MTLAKVTFRALDGCRDPHAATTRTLMHTQLQPHTHTTHTTNTHNHTHTHNHTFQVRHG